jgi:hypothetical protein
MVFKIVQVWIKHLKTGAAASAINRVRNKMLMTVVGTIFRVHLPKAIMILVAISERKEMIRTGELKRIQRRKDPTAFRVNTK